MKLRILSVWPGSRFSSINFFLSSSPAVRLSVSSPPLASMNTSMARSMLGYLRSMLCMLCSMSVVLRLGMNRSAPIPLVDFLPTPT